MANLKFSKNGKPLGRDKVSVDRGNNAWTPEEDAYLRQAIEKNKTCVEVASRLGRSMSSIQTRKWQLKITKRFNPSPRGSFDNFKITMEDKKLGKAGKKESNIIEFVHPAPVSKWENIPLTFKQVPLQEDTTQSTETFVLESNVAIPDRHRKNEKERNKIRELFKTMDINQSFVIPASLSHVTTYLLNQEFPGFKIKRTFTDASKKFVRVFRIA